MIPLVLWQFAQPDRYTDLVAMYRMFQQPPGPRPGVLDAVGAAIRQRLDVYWDTFNPSRLFFTGESSMQISTREVGSFLLPAGVLIMLGIVAIVRQRPQTLGWVLLFGLLTASLPAVVMVDVEIRRWLVVTPFAAMVAGYGVERLRRGPATARAACVLLVALGLLQFGVFTRDYFGPYRERSSFWFGGNIRAAVETTLDDVGERSDPAVYINEDIPWVEAYWRFYAIARGKASLIPHARYVRFETTAPPAASSDALAIVPAQNIAAAEALERAGWVAAPPRARHRRQAVVRDLRSGRRVMGTGATGSMWLPPAISAVALVVLIATMPAEWSDREMPIVSRSAAMAEGVPDASGRTRPFLVHDAGERWLPPLSVYPAAWLRMDRTAGEGRGPASGSGGCGGERGARVSARADPVSRSPHRDSGDRTADGVAGVAESRPHGGRRSPAGAARPRLADRGAAVARSAARRSSRRSAGCCLGWPPGRSRPACSRSRSTSRSA